MRNKETVYREMFPARKKLPEKKIDPLHVKLKVGDIRIIFRIDSGADINVISTKTF